MSNLQRTSKSSDKARDDKERSSKETILESPLTAKGPANRSRFFAVLLVVYFAWLGWLAYVAWVNIASGNQ